MAKKQNNISPSYPGIHLARIDIPKKITTYFQQRGLFVLSLPGYEQIEGKNNESREIIESGNIPLERTEPYPLRNKEDLDRQEAEVSCFELLGRFAKESPRHFTRLTRDYMILGNTLPIKVQAYINGKIKLGVYVKKPNIPRIFGASLYNLLSGNNQLQDFMFNRYSFIEREIVGNHISDINKKSVTKRPLFKESVIRLATLDDFMLINDLGRNVGPINCFDNFIVQSDGICIAFDFNRLLDNPCMYPAHVPFLDLIRSQKIDIPRIMEKQVRSDEARRILWRIHKNQHSFDHLVDLIDQSDELLKHLKEAGYKSAKEFFEYRRRFLISQV